MIIYRVETLLINTYKLGSPSLLLMPWRQIGTKQSIRRLNCGCSVTIVLFYALQWRHKGIIPFQIAGNSTVLSTAFLRGKYEVNTQRCMRIIGPLWRGIQSLTVDSPHKGPEIQKAYSCHDVTMSQCVPFDMRLAGSLLHDRAKSASWNYTLRSSA